MSIQVKSDNGGPHTPQEVKEIYQKLRQQFPKAQITAGDLSQVATAMEGVRAKLPVITAEIGDTWIYGIPSDPMKVARYREVGRLRSEWITTSKFKIGDATDRQLLRRLALAPEHTWGTDYETVYRPRALRA